MRLLLDHNLLYRLVGTLADLYPGSQHVRQLGLTTADDGVLWDFAKEWGLAIVSKDTDFYYRSLLLGCPPKVVWIRLGNCSTPQIAALLQARHADLLAFDDDPAASYLALS